MFEIFGTRFLAIIIVILIIFCSYMYIQQSKSIAELNKIKDAKNKVKSDQLIQQNNLLNNHSTNSTNPNLANNQNNSYDDMFDNLMKLSSINSDNQPIVEQFAVIDTMSDLIASNQKNKSESIDIIITNTPIKMDLTSTMYSDSTLSLAKINLDI